jgi:hypothetical protein
MYKLIQELVNDIGFIRVYIQDEDTGERRFVASCYTDEAADFIIGAAMQTYHRREVLWEACKRSPTELERHYMERPRHA